MRGDGAARAGENEEQSVAEVTLGLSRVVKDEVIRAALSQPILRRCPRLSKDLNRLLTLISRVDSLKVKEHVLIGRSYSEFRSRCFDRCTLLSGSHHCQNLRLRYVSPFYGL